MIVKAILVTALFWATFTCFDRAMKAYSNRQGERVWSDEVVTYCIGGGGLLLACITVVLGM